MGDDLLNKCVIDTSKRKVYLYSEEGKENVVNCDTVEEFLNVLSFVRDKVEEERVFYSDPLRGKINFLFQNRGKKKSGQKLPY